MIIRYSCLYSILLIPPLNQQDIVSTKLVFIVPTSQHGPNLKIYPQNHTLIVDAGRELTCSSQQDLQQKKLILEKSIREHIYSSTIKIFQSIKNSDKNVF